MSRAAGGWLLAGVLALCCPPADARPRHHVPAPGQPPHARVTVWFDPWIVDATPDPREGWVWVPGHYDASGSWFPGHWVPVETRPGWVWVPGYWAPNGYYIDGFWRPATRPGHVWVEGAYGSDRRWHYGHWERRRR